MNENDSLLPQKEWEKKSDNESTLMITPSDIIEWAFCPRFVYYMHTLQLSQHEELRFKVLLGRKFHEEKENRNRPYLRKKIDCIKKEINVYLALPKLRVRGIVDEVLHFSDGFIAPLDYKLTKFRESIFTTHRYQLTLYAMLMREIYHKPVYKGYLVYVDGRSELKEIFLKSPISERWSKF